MSWLKRDGSFRSSLKGKFVSGIAAMTGSNVASSNQNVQQIEHDADACFESFKTHWHQAWNIIRHEPSQISGVEKHLDCLFLLLRNDLRRPNDTVGPVLNLMLTDDILNKLLDWSLKTSGVIVSTLKIQQLKLYDTLVTQSRHELLVRKPVLQPLQRLLDNCAEVGTREVEKCFVGLLYRLCVCFACDDAPLLEFFFNTSSDQRPANFQIFSLLIPYVHREGEIGGQARDALLLCMTLSRKNHEIGVYIAGHSTFCPVLATGLSGLYSLLPRKHMIEAEDWHRFTTEDVRDMPDLRMFLDSLGFCNAVIQVAHPLVQDKLLEYLHQGFLLPVLIPALQPSVQQPCILELTTSIAYLDLFLRTVTEPSVLQAFLKTILLESEEGPSVMTDLVLRIASPHPLCVVTLAFFHTLLSLNCEDVMLELVFKYLIGCTHIMVSQRCRVREMDMFGKTAEKFLSLVPTCCVPNCEGEQEGSNFSSAEHGRRMFPGTLPRTVGRQRRSPSSASFGPGDFLDYSRGHTIAAPSALTPSSFLEYLLDARQTVTSCLIACRCWTWPYDGEQPPPDAAVSLNSSSAFFAKNGGMPSKDVNVCSESRYEPNVNADRLSSRENCKPEDDGVETDQANSHECWSFLSNHDQPNKALKESRQPPLKGLDANQDIRNRPLHLPLMCSMSLTGPNSPADGFGSPDLGPFLSILLTKLENMLSNSIYENFQLTGVISRLACYPQPLLRSFLLNHSLVFQPSVRSLLQVLGTLKQKLDCFFYTIENVDDLMLRARNFLAYRDERIRRDNGGVTVFLEGGRRGSTPEGFNKVERKRRSLTERLFRRNPLNSDRETTNARSSDLDSIPNDTGYRYVKANSSDSPDGRLETLRLKSAVLCVVVLEEFLKELSAIAMEHAVVWEEESELEFLWNC